MQSFLTDDLIELVDQKHFLFEILADQHSP